MGQAGDASDAAAAKMQPIQAQIRNLQIKLSVSAPEDKPAIQSEIDNLSRQLVPLSLAAGRSLN